VSLKYCQKCNFRVAFCQCGKCNRCCPEQKCEKLSPYDLYRKWVEDPEFRASHGFSDSQCIKQMWTDPKWGITESYYPDEPEFYSTFKTVDANFIDLIGPELRKIYKEFIDDHI
jgi:hypothetical protein